MGQRRRVALVMGAVVLLCASLGVQATVIDRETIVEGGEESYPGNTLVGVQSWHGEGKIVEITPDGTVAWEWSHEDARVFGVEQVDRGTVLAAFAVRTPADECKEEFLDYEKQDDHCVHNRVVEIDKETGAVEWEYDWYDEFIHWHEVHDAERLSTGETAIVDMGNDRAFTVNRSGAITWEWNATAHLTPGTPFYEEYGGPEKQGEHHDWTHVNDIDYLPNGHFQLSVRNFDVIVEVDPETNDIVRVVGEPGNHSILDHQHNPHRVGNGSTIVVADSHNDRIVEIDVETGDRIWEYAGPPGSSLYWPRDADRLPNGNTLVTDSRNNRIIEVAPDGEVVWLYEDQSWEVMPLPYDADRVGAGERSTAPDGHEFVQRTKTEGAIVETVQWAVAVSKYVVPGWMFLPQLLQLVGIGFGSGWLIVEGVVFGWRSIRR